MKDNNNGSSFNADEIRKMLAEIGTDNINLFVDSLLMGLGFEFKLIGTKQLKETIVFVYHHPDTPHLTFQNDVYCDVAKHFNTKGPCVARNIRKTIADCTENGNLIVLNDLVHRNLVRKDYPPTNCELIMEIVAWIRLVHQKELNGRADPSEPDGSK